MCHAFFFWLTTLGGLGSSHQVQLTSLPESVIPYMAVVLVFKEVYSSWGARIRRTRVPYPESFPCLLSVTMTARHKTRIGREPKSIIISTPNPPTFTSPIIRPDF